MIIHKNFRRENLYARKSVPVSVSVSEVYELCAGPPTAAMVGKFRIYTDLYTKRPDFFCTLDSLLHHCLGFVYGCPKKYLFLKLVYLVAPKCRGIRYNHQSIFPHSWLFSVKTAIKLSSIVSVLFVGSRVHRLPESVELNWIYSKWVLLHGLCEKLLN